jgi:hypothetical protein
MKSGSLSAYRAAADPEIWSGGTPDDDGRWTCPQCEGRKQIIVEIGLPGDEHVPGNTRVEDCDMCGGSGIVCWDPEEMKRQRGK